MEAGGWWAVWGWEAMGVGGLGILKLTTVTTNVFSLASYLSNNNGARRLSDCTVISCSSAVEALVCPLNCCPLCITAVTGSPACETKSYILTGFAISFSSTSGTGTDAGNFCITAKTTSSPLTGCSLDCSPLSSVTLSGRLLLSNSRDTLLFSGGCGEVIIVPAFASILASRGGACVVSVSSGRRPRAISKASHICALYLHTRGQRRKGTPAVDGTVSPVTIRKNALCSVLGKGRSTTKGGVMDCHIGCPLAFGTSSAGVTA